MALIGVPGSVPHGDIYSPMLYASKTLKVHLETTVFNAIVNRTYESEFKKYGDKITIPYGFKPTAKTYTVDQKIDPENIRIESTEFEIDKGLYISARVNDVQEKQSMLSLMDEWAKHGGWSLANAQDLQILADVHVDADASNRGITAGVESHSYNLGATNAPRAITVANIISVIQDCASVLDEQVVTGERFMVMPHLFVNMLQKALDSEGYFKQAEMVLKNGELPGMLGGFKIYKTNNVKPVLDPSGPQAYNILFGTKDAITYAVQLDKTVDSVPSDNPFSKIRSQLMVYGYKVLIPVELGVLYACKA